MSRPAPLPPLPSWNPLITAPSAGHCQVMPSTLCVFPATIAGCGLDATLLAGALVAGGTGSGGVATFAPLAGCARVETATEVEAAGGARAGPGSFGTVTNTGALFCGRVSRGGAFTTVLRTGALAGGESM